MTYEGRVYHALSGQWSWAIAKDGLDIENGAGYENEDEAREDMASELVIYERLERAQHVRHMVANSRLEGIEPSREDKALHQAYIEGTATLEDLHNHAIAYALEHGEDDGAAAKKHLAAGRPIYYQDDKIAPDQLIREWPGGAMEVVDMDERGDLQVIRTLPTKQEMKKRREALNFALASVKLEGLTPSEEWQAQGEKFATGQLTWEEFFNRPAPAPDA